MVSRQQKFADTKVLAPAPEVDFALVLSRVIASAEEDPSQLRNIIYELARIKLQEEMSRRSPSSNSPGTRDLSLALESAIAGRDLLRIDSLRRNGPKSPPLYPGADPNVMAVTATDVSDRLFNSANQGKYITVAAPGVDILVPAPNGAVQFTTGTSVATANVSGVAALLIAQKPSPRELTCRSR